MEIWRHPSPPVHLARLDPGDGVSNSVFDLLESFDSNLSIGRETKVLIKANFNNDLPAFTGNSTDFRVLSGIVEWLRARGANRLALADGPNVGVHRRRLDVFEILGARRFARLHDLELVDLNEAPSVCLRLEKTKVHVARPVLDADLVINVPKVKTHCEAVYSSAVKNLVGVVSGRDKRRVHRSLIPNLASLGVRVPTHLQVLDGVVAMEGNGPGDGDPVNLDMLAVAVDPFELDLLVSALIGFEAGEIPYLDYAQKRGWLRYTFKDLEMPPWRVPAFEKAPRMALAAKLASSRWLYPLKVMARPVTDRPEVAATAKRMGLIQDVYLAGTPDVRPCRSRPDACTRCEECVRACPQSLSWDEIGDAEKMERCISCMYCVWACPTGAMDLIGSHGPLARVIERYPPVSRRPAS